MAGTEDREGQEETRGLRYKMVDLTRRRKGVVRCDCGCGVDGGLKLRF